jgi:hypothetical protein
MKKLSFGKQSIKKIYEGGCVYADKTKFVYDSIVNGNAYFYRGFG